MLRRGKNQPGLQHRNQKQKKIQTYLLPLELNCDDKNSQAGLLITQEEESAQEPSGTLQSPEETFLSTERDGVG